MLTEKPKIGEELRATAKAAVEAAGGAWVGVCGDSIKFSDPETGARHSLFVFACNAENVRLTLKAGREQVGEFHPWERVAVGR